MIHNRECRRCTHEWTTSCMGEMMQKPEDREKHKRQMHSRLCWDCFEQLESGEIEGLPLFELSFYLDQKFNKYGGYSIWSSSRKYSGMCREIGQDTFKPDGSIDVRGYYESGKTAEHEQLGKLSEEVEDIYLDHISRQRTQKRIELDQWREAEKRGYVLFGSQPRPDNFIGDPPGKQRFEVLFGLDMSSGSILPPTIKMNDGTR